MSMFSHRFPPHIRVHCNVISPWVASHIEQGPPTGDREHFISHWHVHLYPHRPAEGCWSCQPWGNERGTQALPESKQRENYICDHRAELVTKSLRSLKQGKFFMLLYFNVARPVSHSVFASKQPEELYHSQVKGKHRGCKRQRLLYRGNKIVMACFIPSVFRRTGWTIYCSFVCLWSSQGQPSNKAHTEAACSQINWISYACREYKAHPI